MQRRLLICAADLALGPAGIPGAAALGLQSFSSPPGFDSVHRQLADLLIPAEYEMLLEEFIWRQDFAGVLTILVYDFPTHVQYVSKSHAAAWGRSHDQLIDLGIDNVLRGTTRYSSCRWKSRRTNRLGKRTRSMTESAG